MGDKAASGRDGFVVQAYANGGLASQQIDADASSVDITLDDVAEGPTQLDVVVLIDTTGSMGDEIDRIEALLEEARGRSGKAGKKGKKS